MKKDYVLNADQLMSMKTRFEKKRTELIAIVKNGQSKYLKGDLEKLRACDENLITIKSALAVVNLKINTRIYDLKYTLEYISAVHQGLRSKGIKSKEMQTELENLQQKVNTLKADVNTYNGMATCKITLTEE